MKKPSIPSYPFFIALGYNFAKGAVTYLCRCFLYVVAVLFLAHLARNYFAWGIDDSDFSGWKRSGLQLHTDAKTGIQYFSDGKGGLCRRELR